MFKKRILLIWLGCHDADAETNGQGGPVAMVLLAADVPSNQVHTLASGWLEELDCLDVQPRTDNVMVKSITYMCYTTLPRIFPKIG